MTAPSRGQHGKQWLPTQRQQGRHMVTAKEKIIKTLIFRANILFLEKMPYLCNLFGISY